MIERGPIVKVQVAKSGVKLVRLCKHLNISRPTLYRRFEDPNVDYDFIRAVGEVIHHDFSEQFPEMKKAPGLKAEALPTELDSLVDCKDQLLHVYGLYTDILQKYNALLQAQA